MAADQSNIDNSTTEVPSSEADQIDNQDWPSYQARRSAENKTPKRMWDEDSKQEMASLNTDLEFKQTILILKVKNKSW